MCVIRYLGDSKHRDRPTPFPKKNPNLILYNLNKPELVFIIFDTI